MLSMAHECRMYAQEAKGKWMDIEQKVISTIELHHNDAEKDLLLKLWHEETEAAKEACRLRSQKSWDWLKTLPETKPYHGYQQSSVNHSVPQQTNQAHYSAPVGPAPYSASGQDLRNQWENDTWSTARGRRGQRQNRRGKGQTTLNLNAPHRNPWENRGYGGSILVESSGQGSYQTQRPPPDYQTPQNSDSGRGRNGRGSLGEVSNQHPSQSQQGYDGYPPLPNDQGGGRGRGYRGPRGGGRGLPGNAHFF